MSNVDWRLVAIVGWALAGLLIGYGAFFERMYTDEHKARRNAENERDQYLRFAQDAAVELNDLRPLGKVIHGDFGGAS